MRVHVPHAAERAGGLIELCAAVQGTFWSVDQRGAVMHSPAQRSRNLLLILNAAHRAAAAAAAALCPAGRWLSGLQSDADALQLQSGCRASAFRVKGSGFRA